MYCICVKQPPASATAQRSSETTDLLRASRTRSQRLRSEPGAPEALFVAALTDTGGNGVRERSDAEAGVGGVRILRTHGHPVRHCRGAGPLAVGGQRGV
jgi:hypothetical protein